MKNLKKFASYYKPHLGLFILDTLCCLASAVIALVYPLVARQIYKEYVPNHDVTHFYIWCAILLILYFLKALITYVITYWGHKVGVLIQADMRQELFHKLQKLPFSYYDENKTGTIMSRIINDLQEISELAHHGPEDTFTSVLTLIGSFIVVCVINWRLGLLVFAIIPFLIFFAGHRRKVQKNSFKQMRIKTAEINAEVESSIAGIRVA
ncbi:MAG: ABC transporter ATP-binding protein, partial [Bacilli bacterium]|nr:ABC transporter ATP-binding protein [Bacilli bacterium]